MKRISKSKNLNALLFIFSLILGGCSTAPEIKTQNYAQLRSQRTFEYEFQVVWNAIEEVFRKLKVARNPDNLEPNELKKAKARTLETDWIYTQSRNKYHEYQVDGFPRKIYLQMRYKYFVEAKKKLGGIQVNVSSQEEIEKINPDGTSAGFADEGHPDSSRLQEVLEKIKFAILAAP